MNIKRFTDYSLRILIYLALKEDQLVTIKEVADRYKISKNHLMKVVQTLNAEDFVTATRGKNGGMTLNRSPALINIGALVRITEQDAPLVECFGADNQCIITPACQLKNILAEAMESFYTCLDQYTLADLLGTNDNGDSNKVMLTTLLNFSESKPEKLAE